MNQKSYSLLFVGFLFLVVGIAIGLLIAGILVQRRPAPAVMPIDTAVEQDDMELPTTLEEDLMLNQDSGETMTARIPLVTDQPTAFGPFGCDSYLRFEAFEVPETVGVLRATYGVLFSEARPGNLVEADDNLSFDRVEIIDGFVDLYLSGDIDASACDIPALRAQIEEAAFQFGTVEGIAVYLNGQVYDWCTGQFAGGDLCAEGPQYWIIDKE